MKILVAYTGGTKLDKAVLVLAKKHAKAFNGKIYIAHSMESLSEKEIDDLDKIKSDLEHLKISVEKEGIPCETHVLIRGVTPGADLVDYASDEKIDEIIIGLEKKSRVGKLFFGSNAQYIILEADCPVVSMK